MHELRHPFPIVWLQHFVKLEWLGRKVTMWGLLNQEEKHNVRSLLYINAHLVLKCIQSVCYNGQN